MFVVLKKYRTPLGVTPDRSAEPYVFLPRSFSKRRIAAFVAQTKRAVADQAVGHVARAGGVGG
jgi:hypothetical protein